MAEFAVDLVESSLASSTQAVGRNIIYQPVTGTTMDDALVGADNGKPHGTAYIAEVQTKARGSKGRKWNAKNSGNLYVSFIIHKDIKQDISDEQLKILEYDLDISAALATMCAVEEEGVTGVTVKWLNDLWIRGHKLCGALAEYKKVIEVGGEEKHLLILGIGLNINVDIRRDSSMAGLATSTLCETGRELSREKVFARLCDHLERILAMERGDLVQMYTDRQTLQQGRAYKVTHIGGDGASSVRRFVGVKDDWSIDLQADSGETINVFWTQVSVRPNPEKSVYILSGPHIEEWSSQLLTNTMRTLIDTTEFNIRTVELNDGKAIPEDCALIVIGHWKVSPDPAVANQITEYVKEGGACLCTGNSCHIFSPSQKTDATPAEATEITIRPVSLSKGENPVTLSLPCFFNQQVSLQDILGISEKDITILASHQTDDRVNREIIVAKLDKGRACLSLPSVEITYVDVEEMFPALMSEMGNLRKDVFHRDSLILTMLRQLGLECEPNIKTSLSLV